MTFGELVASLRQIDGQRGEGKHPPNVHFRSKPFLHVRNGPDRTYADVRFSRRAQPHQAAAGDSEEGRLGPRHLASQRGGTTYLNAA